jgi:thymidylate synthase ThyX
MKNRRKIYLIKDLPEETIAVCFARCSRCSDDFATIASQLDEDQSRRFHERWVIGYGHSSVAEHAVAHVAFENVSQLAVENIESNRLASYTEKSSRYQVFAKGSYFIPDQIKKAPGLLAVYQEAIDGLFDLYHRSLAPIKEEIKKIFPKDKGEKETEYQARIHSKYIDVARMVLPTCLLANLGMTANARTFEYAISKLLSSIYPENQAIGRELKKTLKEICPTLIKYAERNDYYQFINRLDFKNESRKIRGKRVLGSKSVRLVWHDPFGNERFISAMLYRFGRGDLKTLFRAVKNWPLEKQRKFINKALSPLKDHNKPPRELEHIYLTFDCLIDQGGYYDLKRNRMMTQTTQELGINYGFVIPLIWVKAGLKDAYLEAIGKTETAYRRIAERHPLAAIYLVTKAHKRRFLMTMNLREMFYWARLRGGPWGHSSYRRIAMKCFEEAKKIYPDLLRFVRVKDYPSSEKIEKDFFYQT